MKKLYFALVALMLCAVSASAGEMVYFKPNSNWTQASADFCIYCWPNAGWINMQLVESGIYGAELPDSYTGFKFVRMNPERASNGWDANQKWNEDSDVDLTAKGSNNLYTLNSGWDNCGGTWSTYTPTTTEPEEPVEGTRKIYCYDQTGWTTLNLHYWGGTPETSWPGETSTAEENVGNYTYSVWEVPASTTGLVFNNGSVKTSDITITAGTDALYYTVSVGGAYKVVDPNGEMPSFEKHRLYVNNQTDWTSIYAYSWDANSVNYFGTWPGTQMTKVEDAASLGLAEGGNWYYVEYDSQNVQVSLIFNNNSGAQTDDLVSELYVLDKDLYITLSKALTVGVNEIAVDENAPVEYFNFQGVRVANPEKGMYIRVQGGKATKVIL